MKTRFLLNLLTTSSKKSGAGFAMPMVIMVGLVITVAAVAIVMKGMNDQNQATSQAVIFLNNLAKLKSFRRQ